MKVFCFTISDKPPHKPHYEQLPTGWTFASLGDIGNWQAGGTPNRQNSAYYNGNIPWLKTGDLNDGYIRNIPESITELGLSESSAKLNSVGSVLIAMYGATIGKLGILEFPAATNQACCACLVFDEVDSKYLFYFLMEYRDKFIESGIGGAQPNISKEIIVQTTIPLPPLAEQHRIVATIEATFTLIDKIEQDKTDLLEAINATKSRILTLAISGKLVPQDPSDEPASVLLGDVVCCDSSHYGGLPRGWVETTLGELGTTNIGLTYKPDNISHTGVAVLRSNNVQNGKISYDNLVYVTSEVPKKSLAEKGDILICARNGSRALVGKSAIIERDGMAFGAFMAIYRSKCNPYIQLFLASQAFRQQLDRANTSTVNQITQNMLKQIIVPLPPLNEQQRIVAVVEVVYKKLDDIIAAIS